MKLYVIYDVDTKTGPLDIACALLFLCPMRRRPFQITIE